LGQKPERNIQQNDPFEHGQAFFQHDGDLQQKTKKPKGVPIPNGNRKHPAAPRAERMTRLLASPKSRCLPISSKRQFSWVQKGIRPPWRPVRVLIRPENYLPRTVWKDIHFTLSLEVKIIIRTYGKPIKLPNGACTGNFEIRPISKCGPHHRPGQSLVKGRRESRNRRYLVDLSTMLRARQSTGTSRCERDIGGSWK